MPSPYRPIHLSADSTELREYRELKRSLMEAESMIEAQKIQLSELQDNLDVESRSRKKSNEALIAATQALTTLQRDYDSLKLLRDDYLSELNSIKTNNLAIAVQTTDSFVERTRNLSKAHDHQSIKENNSSISIKPNTSPENEDSKLKFDNMKQQYNDLQKKYVELLHNGSQGQQTKISQLAALQFNTANNELINELNKKLTSAEGIEKQTLNYRIKSINANQNILYKLHALQTLAGTTKTRLDQSQIDLNFLQIDKENLLSKLKVSVQDTKKMQESSELVAIKNCNLQKQITACLEKAAKLEKSEKVLHTLIQQLQDKHKNLSELLPDSGMMTEYLIVHKQFKKLKEETSKLWEFSRIIKCEKVQEKFESILKDNNHLRKKISAHISCLQEVKGLNQSLTNDLEPKK